MQIFKYLCKMWTQHIQFMHLCISWNIEICQRIFKVPQLKKPCYCYRYFLWQTASSKEIKPLFRKNRSSKSPKFTFCWQFHKYFWKHKPKYFFSNETFKDKQRETFCIDWNFFSGLSFQKSQHKGYLSFNNIFERK